jgi:hypothetical protein
MSLHTADSALTSGRERPSSIDLTLELERQLENDAVAPDSTSADRPASLDTHVLASIIMQLRHSLSDVSRERDELSRRLSAAQAQESHLNATVQELGSELEVARRKIADDESAISMLRAKVEESRFVSSLEFICYCLSDPS